MNTLNKITMMFLTLVLACLLHTGCMFRELREEVEEEKISFRLYGRIDNIQQAEGHVWVLLYAQEQGKLQLDTRAQDDAVFVRGLNEDHMSILESVKAAEYLNLALESTYGK